jgi:hypothetical protein
MDNCGSCWHLTALHDERGCHADRLAWNCEREEYCGCTEAPAALSTASCLTGLERIDGR